MKYNINTRGLAEYIGDLKIVCSMKQTGEYEGTYHIAPNETEEGHIVQISMNPFVPMLRTFMNNKGEFYLLISVPDFTTAVWVKGKDENSNISGQYDISEDDLFESQSPDSFSYPLNTENDEEYLGKFIGDPKDEDYENENIFKSKRNYSEELIDTGLKSTFINIPAVEFSVVFKRKPQELQDFIAGRTYVQEIIATAVDDIIRKHLSNLFVNFTQDTSEIYIIETKEKIEEFSEEVPEFDS